MEAKQPWPREFAPGLGYGMGADFRRAFAPLADEPDLFAGHMLHALVNLPAEAGLKTLAATIKARWVCEQAHQSRHEQCRSLPAPR